MANDKKDKRIPMITVTEFSRERNLSRSRILLLINQGRIKAKRFGNQFLITESKILPPKWRGRPKKNCKRHYP